MPEPVGPVTSTMPFGLCIVGGLILYFAVRRVQKKLDPANKPTIWEFINELGGYALPAVILITYAVITFLFGMLNFLF